jgi:two-component system sensor histidine kinase PilS (NtrC family)
MTDQDTVHSWFGPPEDDAQAQGLDDTHEFGRLWQGFMTARLTLGMVLMVLQTTLYATGTSNSKTLIAISTAYFIGTLATRLFARPRPLGGAFNRTWGILVGVDVLAFSMLQFLQGSGINYTPLFALPILLVSVLGSLRLALGTAAGVTMVLLGANLFAYLQSPTDATPYFVQSALSGAGYFFIALLANQLSSRLVSEGQRARLSQLAASSQRQVNELVIESLADGVLILDERGCVRAANPAARQLLGSQRALRSTNLDLNDEIGWRPLLNLMRLTIASSNSQEEDVTIRHEDHGPRRLRARTRLATPLGAEGENLCVVFLQDQREIEARLRTEKLASMGRMSTAVAHEIRNPLAAIIQANALLDEDLADPKLKKLTAMVEQNGRRLEKIVDDILNVSRVQPEDPNHTSPSLEINHFAALVCQDWTAQSALKRPLLVQPAVHPLTVRFDAEHLRRVMVNLLDNALRYASEQPDSIQLSIKIHDANRTNLAIWSDGAPMDQSVERHLFEPFFSSESRSSGLGLFICRELCERHGASIIYQRNFRTAYGKSVEGNEFVISLVRSDHLDIEAPQGTTSHLWQSTLY